MDMIITFLLSFFYGILSAFSPCVLPIIPIIVGHSLLTKNKINIISFLLGFFFLFTIITVLTVIFTVAINYYLHYFRVFAAILIIVIGTIFILNRDMFNFSYSPKQQNDSIGSFLFGFLTSLAWSPCISPYMITVIALSASFGNWMLSTANMMSYYVGFSLILVLIAYLSSKINLNKIIQHSNEIRIFSGILIIFSGIYILLGNF